MTYGEARAFLAGCRPGEIKPGLERMQKVLKLSGQTLDRQAYIHVAGTNGKGSTAAMIAGILTAAGKRVGLYSSPAVTGLRDTITIDGQPIGEERFAGLVQRLSRWQTEMGEAGPLSEFELVTALALLYFAEEQTDFTVLECGMGGRDDATNVIPPPRAAVITPVALDHTAWLGETLEEIAANKSAIIKHPCTAVTCPSQPEEALAALMERTAAEGVRLLIPRMETAELLEEGPEGSTFVYDGCRIALPLLGDRQRENAVTAVEAARVCLPGLSSRDIEQGLASVRMPCRQELIRREPPLLLDGAHNPHGVGALAETVQSLWGKGRITLLIGMLADKETARCAALLAPLCRRAVCCTPRGPRPALPAEELKRQLERGGCRETYAAEDPALALELAFRLAGKKPVVVAGSFYLGAELRPLLVTQRDKKGNAV